MLTEQKAHEKLNQVIHFIYLFKIKYFSGIDISIDTNAWIFLDNKNVKILS